MKWALPTIAEVVLWWGVSFCVWMITLSAAPLGEYLLAAACSLPCGLAAAGARRATGDHWTLRPGWLRPALLLPVALVSDTAQVFAAAARGRRVGSNFARVPTGALDDVTEARSRRALATAWVSVTPGSYVLDSDPSTGELTVHSLAQRGPRMEKAVQD